MVAQTGSMTSLEDDFHSPIDSEDKDEESRLFDDAGFFCRDAKTDTEDLAWMISIGKSSLRHVCLCTLLYRQRGWVGTLCSVYESVYGAKLSYPAR